MHGGNVAIVGASETREVGVLPDRSVIQLHGEAALLALADAGLTAADVDGVATAGPLPLEVSHHLGITPRWLDGTMVGGCSFMLHVTARRRGHRGRGGQRRAGHARRVGPVPGRRLRLPGQPCLGAGAVRGAVRRARPVRDVHRAGPSGSCTTGG